MEDKLEELPGSEQIKSLFDRVASDRNRGSRELNNMLLEGLLSWTFECSGLTQRHVHSVCKKITKLRPEMAALTNTGYLLQKLYREEPDGGSRIEALQSVLRKLRARLEKTDENLAGHYVDSKLADRDVMTFSRSSTVLKLLLRSPGPEKSVVLHSYPGEEGIDLAEDLKEELDVTFGYDVEAGYFLPKVDALYLGVDSLFEDGSIVNKTGSRLLARSAENTPVRVITDTWKLVPERMISEVPRYPSPESLPEELQRGHPLFETVPAALIDSYITERGVFESPDRLVDSCAELRQARSNFERRS